jgi:hypothetical protein
MFTIRFANGASPQSFATQEELEAHIEAEITEGYELDYFEDRGLLWACKEDSTNDDGQKAIATINWAEGDR